MPRSMTDRARDEVLAQLGLAVRGVAAGRLSVGVGAPARRRRARARARARARDRRSPDERAGRRGRRARVHRARRAPRPRGAAVIVLGRDPALRAIAERNEWRQLALVDGKLRAARRDRRSTAPRSTSSSSGSSRRRRRQPPDDDDPQRRAVPAQRPHGRCRDEDANAAQAATWRRATLRRSRLRCHRRDDGARSGPAARGGVRSHHRSMGSASRASPCPALRRGDVIAPRIASALRRTARIAIERPRAALWTLLALTCALFAVGVAGLAADHVDRWTRDRPAASASMVVYLGEGVDDARAHALAAELREAARRRARRAGRRDRVRARGSQQSLGADSALLEGVELASLPASVEVTLAPGVRDVIAMSPTVRALRGDAGRRRRRRRGCRRRTRSPARCATVRLVAWTGAALFAGLALIVVLASIRVRLDPRRARAAVAAPARCGPAFIDRADRARRCAAGRASPRCSPRSRSAVGISLYGDGITRACRRARQGPARGAGRVGGRAVRRARRRPRARRWRARRSKPCGSLAGSPHSCSSRPRCGPSKLTTTRDPKGALAEQLAAELDTISKTSATVSEKLAERCCARRGRGSRVGTAARWNVRLSDRK